MNWKQVMIRWRWISLAILSCGVVLGCSGPQTLVMGTSADYPPYEFKDQGGEIVGFDVDIATAIAEELNYELEIRDMDFDTLIDALAAEEVDFVMAGMSPTAERLERVDFTQRYYENESVIVALGSDPITTVDELQGKTIGAQEKTIQAEAVAAMEGITLVPMAKVGELIQGLKAETVDAIVVERNVAEKYTASNPDLVLGDRVPTETAGSAIAFPKGSPYTEKFDTVLQEMKDNGEIKALVQKWFD
ncbi:transporter substrate-binding domain-containing protein [Spirulina subsalsa CS-330]|nr:transporter substrate-binding domain-containing protein [Spirulina subsalsa CS-330]